MSRVVKMHILCPINETEIKILPEKSRIVSVCVIHEEIKFFVEQDPDDDFRSTSRTRKVEFAVFNYKRYFYIDNYQFLGTIILDYGNTIYHVYYRDIE